MGELASAIDLLAADDLPGLPAPALLDRLAGLLREQNRMAAEIVRTVRACDTSGAAEFDGLRNMPSWLRGHGHLSPGRRGRSWTPAGPWSTCPWSRPRSPTAP